MPLTPGTRLGPFEIISPLGAGGMGEVYRARDTKLHRNVAIKVLPAEVAGDAERLARFEREARTLASLNHPGIGQIHGLEHGALILELVDGEDLSARIARGPLPLDEALSIARQIADALDAAHSAGIVHRDLKPSNVKVRADGAVKVLDFGLAKPLDSPEARDFNPATLANSPTITSPALTQAGIILGTAAYMSPEQARGRPVDKRTDIWAFGCVLFEMLTGRPAFEGETVTDILGAIVKSEPYWSRLPVETPPGVTRLLRHTLQKDASKRLRDIGDAIAELDLSAAGPPATDATMRSQSRAHPSVPWVAGITLVAAVAGAVIATVINSSVLRQDSQAAVLLSRFAIVPPPADPLTQSGADRDIAVSPDGRFLVYRASGLALGGPLMLRALDRIDAQPLAGVVRARAPFFSPDSRWVGFFEGGELKRVSITGGPVMTLARLTGLAMGRSLAASWGDDHTIVFSTNDPGAGLARIPESGGEVSILTTPDASQQEGRHSFPSVLGGRGVLFTIEREGQADNAQVAVLDLKTGNRKTLIRGGSHAEYLPSGHLIYATAGTLRAVRFDPVRLQVLSDSVPVVEGVTIAPTGAANYAVSKSGTLVYVASDGGDQSNRSLVWVDRNGQEQLVKAPPRAYVIPRLSPEGGRVALDVRDQQNDIWIWDLARQTMTRLTNDPGLDRLPVWTPDGQRVVFSSERAGASNLYEQAADGTGTIERLTTGVNSQQSTSITPDGTGIIGHEFTAATSNDVLLFPRTNRDGERLVDSRFDEMNADISPNGQYVAYQSNESSRIEVYVRAFGQASGGRWQVSTEGGSRPAWARSGRELFYLDASNKLTTVPINTAGTTFSAGHPVRILNSTYATPVGGRSYDVAPDGQRFLMIKENAQDVDKATPVRMVVVLNWIDELKARVPSK